MSSILYVVNTPDRWVVASTPPSVTPAMMQEKFPDGLIARSLRTDESLEIEGNMVQGPCDVIWHEGRWVTSVPSLAKALDVGIKRWKMQEIASAN